MTKDKVLWLWWYWIQRNKRCKIFVYLLNDGYHYKPIKTNDYYQKLMTIILNMKVSEIRTKLYQLKNILILSDHI